MTLWTAQRACEIQVASQSLGQELIEIPPSVLEQCSRVSLQYDANYGGGADVFNALIRQIDRIGQSYKL